MVKALPVQNLTPTTMLSWFWMLILKMSCLLLLLSMLLLLNVVAANVVALQSQHQARPTAWGGWGYCDPLCSKAKTFGWEGQLKLLEVSTIHSVEGRDYLKERKEFPT